MSQGATKGDAELLEAKLLVSAQDCKTYIPGDPPLSEIMSLYVEHSKTLRSGDTSIYHAVRIRPWCVGFTASQSKRVVDKFVADCIGAYKPATINRSIGALKKALRIAWEIDATPEDYGAKIRRVPENNERTEWVSPEQAQKIALSASEGVKPMIWIALMTGCRRGEILKMKKEDIQSDHIIIHSGNTKTLKSRIVPIIPALRPWLKSIPIDMQPKSVTRAFARAAEKAGFGHLRFHDLRHGCATTLVQHGVDLYTIQQILGHSTPKMTQRYAKMSLDVKKSAMNKLAKAIKDAA